MIREEGLWVDRLIGRARKGACIFENSMSQHHMYFQCQEDSISKTFQDSE